MTTCNVCEGARPRLRSERNSGRCEECEQTFDAYIGDDWGLGEQVARREAAIGTGVCAECEAPCDMDKGLCDHCRMPRRSRDTEPANPYKKVWTSVEDEEKYILDSVRNGTLFIPTPAIMAERHRATARYCRNKARTLDTVAADQAMTEAENRDNLAKVMDALDNEIKAIKRPKEFGFTVKEGQ